MRLGSSRSILLWVLAGALAAVLVVLLSLFVARAGSEQSTCDRFVGLPFGSANLSNNLVGADDVKDEVRTFSGWLTELPAHEGGDTRLPLDGSFTTQTDAAVRRFQGIQGLQVDGLVGKRTWQRACELASRY